MSLIWRKNIRYNGKATKVFVTMGGNVVTMSGPVKTYSSGSGYLTFALCAGLTKDGKPTTIRRYVHRVVAEAFVPNPDNLPQVNHKDGVKSNNAASNLEWVSNSRNIKHAHENRLNENRKGIIPKRLTEEEVVECYTRVKKRRVDSERIKRYEQIQNYN